MKIHVLSDLHHEFGWKYEPERLDADVVVLAGDIDKGVAGIEWAADTFETAVYVAGNHEFYKGRLDLYERMRDVAEARGVHFLQDSSAVIGGVRFIGATLWTDFNLNGQRDLAMIRAPHVMNDYRRIQEEPGRNLRAPTVARMHMASRVFLMGELQSSLNPIVVVTHHAPHAHSIGERFRNSDANEYYASDLSSILLEPWAPPLWIHGHTHGSLDYTVGKTRVVANCHGYPRIALGDRSGGFQPENREFQREFLVAVAE